MNTAIISTGLISVVTDQKEFFFDMLEIAENDHRFTKTHTERFLDHYQSDVKSRFQLAWERINRPIYRFELTKS